MKKKFVKIILCFLFTVGIFACSDNKDSYILGGIQSDSTIEQIIPARMSSGEYALAKKRIDSLMKAPDRVILCDSLSQLFMIPDSILQNADLVNDPNFEIRKYWTPHQVKLDSTLAETQLQNLKIVNDKLVLDISRDDFVKKGLPADYYDFLVQSYDDINFFNKVYKITPSKIEDNLQNLQNEYKNRIARDSK